MTITKNDPYLIRGGKLQLLKKIDHYLIKTRIPTSSKVNIDAQFF